MRPIPQPIHRGGLLGHPNPRPTTLRFWPHMERLGVVGKGKPNIREWSKRKRVNGWKMRDKGSFYKKGKKPQCKSALYKPDHTKP